MVRFLLPFFGAFLVILILRELPQGTEQLKEQHLVLWEDWDIKPHLYQSDESAILLLRFIELNDTPKPLPKEGYEVALRAGNNNIPLQLPESVQLFNGERLFYTISDPLLLNTEELTVTVKVGNQPTKEARVTSRPSSQLLIAAMLGDAAKLQKLTSTMEDSADKFFYAAIANELQHKTKDAVGNYKRALELTSYRKNEMPNMLLFKRYEALNVSNRK